MATMKALPENPNQPRMLCFPKHSFGQKRIVQLAFKANAVCERSFSAMGRLKNYLHSTMGQKQLNAAMLLHVHKNKTEQLSVIDLANALVGSEHRMSVFGHFSENDL